jgi:hypothetical protein
MSTLASTRSLRPVTSSISIVADPRAASALGFGGSDATGASTRTGKKAAALGSNFGGDAFADTVADAYWRRQRNNRLEWTLCPRATSQTVAPLSTSATIANFCSRLNCRRVLATTSNAGWSYSPDIVPSYRLLAQVGTS